MTAAKSAKRQLTERDELDVRRHDYLTQKMADLAGVTVVADKVERAARPSTNQRSEPATLCEALGFAREREADDRGVSMLEARYHNRWTSVRRSLEAAIVAMVDPRRAEPAVTREALE